jgi:hypothetical protein
MMLIILLVLINNNNYSEADTIFSMSSILATQLYEHNSVDSS